MAVEITREEYTYQIENRVFIVTPVYKEKGEPLRDILLKLMLADIEPRGPSGDILNTCREQRSNIYRIKPLV